MHKIIFFGNGLLAETAKSVLERQNRLIFHAKSKEDLEKVKEIKRENPDAFGILASFGVLIKSDVLDLFEPEGILNIHPSLLPRYRGSSPIESAILTGDTSFSVSVMKLVKQMDAGPVFFQDTLENLPLDKAEIYRSLATSGATWLNTNLDNFQKLRESLATPISNDTSIPNDTPFITTAASLFPGFFLQNDSEATFTKKLDKSMSRLSPDTDSAETTLRKIVAFQSFPKPKYTFFGQEAIILSAHIVHSQTDNQTIPPLSLKCADGNYLVIDRLQPLSRKPMDAASFLNGLKNRLK